MRNQVEDGSLVIRTASDPWEKGIAHHDMVILEGDGASQSRIERRARGKTGLWEVCILADVRSAQIGHPYGKEGRPRTQHRAHSEGQGTFV